MFNQVEQWCTLMCCYMLLGPSVLVSSGKEPYKGSELNSQEFYICTLCSIMFFCSVNRADARILITFNSACIYTLLM